MDDDMNAVDLKISPQLESRMKFFYSPYGQTQSPAFYMKFYNGKYKRV